MRIRRAALAIFIAASVAAATGCTAGTTGHVEDVSLAADSSSAPLEILLTDDDGWDAPGIQAVYEALTDNGYDVTMVAPAENHSGASAGFDFTGEVTVKTHHDDPDMYSVSATPVGSLLFGLNELFADNPPDLVISGTNVGANIGADSNYSGTLGAAVVAAGTYDIPAIAISTDTVRDADGQHGAYEETADLVIDILDRGLPQMPEHTVLNINYPVLKDGATEPDGYVYAPLSDKSQAKIQYRKLDDTTYELVPSRSDAQPDAGTDWAELESGNATFTLLDTNRTASAPGAAGIKDLVAQLNDETEPSVSGSLGSLFEPES